MGDISKTRHYGFLKHWAELSTVNWDTVDAVLAQQSATIKRLEAVIGAQGREIASMNDEWDGLEKGERRLLVHAVKALERIADASEEVSDLISKGTFAVSPDRRAIAFRVHVSEED